MRWSLLAIRAGIAAISLFIVVMVVLSVMPLASGGLKVDMPEEDEGSGSLGYSYEDGVITVSIPLDIYNGGYFAIEDLRFHIEISEDGVLLTETSSESADIVPGKENNIVLKMPVDLNDLDQDDRRRLVFEGADLTMDIRVEAVYPLGLSSASIMTAQDMVLDPLISDVSADTGNARFYQNGPDINVEVPYSFGASGMIKGMDFDLRAALSNASAELAHIDLSVTVMEQNYGLLTFVIPESAANELLLDSDQELTVGIDVTFAEATVHLEFPVRWGGMS